MTLGEAKARLVFQNIGGPAGNGVQLEIHRVLDVIANELEARAHQRLAVLPVSAGERRRLRRHLGLPPVNMRAVFQELLHNGQCYRAMMSPSAMARFRVFKLGIKFEAGVPLIFY